MKRSRLWIAAAALVAALIVYRVWLKPPPSPEELVRRLIVQMARAVEAHDVAFVMEQLSPRFRSNDRFNREETRRVLEANFAGGQWRRLFVDQLDTFASSSHSVTAHVRIIFGRGDAQNVRDLARNSVFAAYQIDAVAEREGDGAWRFVSARLVQVEPTQLP